MAEKKGAGGKPQEYDKESGQYGGGTTYRQNTTYDEILKNEKTVSKKKKYSKAVDSAVMSKYSAVRDRVNKKGSATVKVNDGKNFYIVRINKSDDDFDYNILKAWKIND